MADQLFWCRFQVEFLACTAGVSTVVFPIFAELAAELSSSVCIFPLGDFSSDDAVGVTEGCWMRPHDKP